MKGAQQDQLIQVLIIEDDLRIAEINRRFVEKVEGYQVIGIATNEHEAKEQLEVFQPDLVLLDIYFPEASGLDLLWFIQRNFRNTNVIMITAARELDSVKEALRGGAFDFIVKPLVFERFKSTLVNFQKYRKKLTTLNEDKEQIGQEEIDQLLRGIGNIGQTEAYLPKGIDKLTLEKVCSVIQFAGTGLTAEEVGRKIKASRSTARRYLEYLVSTGEIVADLSYGAVGRPERQYKTKS